MARSKMTPEWRAKIALTRRKQEADKKQFMLAAKNAMLPIVSSDIDVKAPLVHTSLYEAIPSIVGLPSADVIAGILNGTTNGMLRDWMELCDSLEKDPQLTGLAVSRKNAVAGKPLAIQPIDLDDESKMVANFIKYSVRSISNFQSAVYHLLDAVFRGIAACEIVWGYDETNEIYLPIQLNPIHGKKLGFDKDFDVVFMDPWNPELNGKKLRDYPNKFIIHTPIVNSIYPTRDGLYRSAVFYSFFKNKALAYWLNGAERFAVPTIYAKVGQQTNSDVMLDLRRSLATLTSAGVAVFKKDIEIESLTSGMAGGDQVWLGLIRYCDSQNTKLIAGGTLTVDAGNAGSYALGEVHERVRQDLLEADGEALCRTLERDLFQAIVRMNEHIMPENASLPSAYFDGLVVYKPIDQMDIDAGVIRRNDILREKGLPEIAVEDGGEDFIITPSQGNTLLALVEKTEAGTISIEGAKNLTTLAFPLMSDEQVNSLFIEPEVNESELAVAAPDAASVADAALNGAQMSSLVEILNGIGAKTIAPRTAEILIKAAVPTMSEQIIKEMVDSQTTVSIAVAPKEIPVESVNPAE